MKYIFGSLAVSALILAGCASSSKNTDPQKQQQASYAQQQVESVIVDEEFDLLVAPQYDYNSNVPYAQQIKTKPEAKSAAKKSNVKPKAYKQN
jgi:PBP1b-binding outer membrane lipoprotein LpoB